MNWRKKYLMQKQSWINATISIERIGNKTVKYDYGLFSYLSITNNRLKSIDIKNEKKEYEIHKVDFEKMLDELTQYLDEDSPFEIEAKFPGYVPNPDFTNKKTVSTITSVSTRQTLTNPVSIQQRPTDHVPVHNKTLQNSNVNHFDASKTENMFDHDMDLTEQSWFHGVLSRNESEKLLEKDGDFLVRVSFIFIN